MARKAFLFFSFLFFSSLAIALADVNYSGARQFNGSIDNSLLLGNEYERYQWDNIGGEIEIHAYNTAPFEDGEYWSIALYKSGETLQLIKEEKYIYDYYSGFGCIQIPYYGGYRSYWCYLNFNANRPPELTSVYKLKFSFNAKCLDDGEYVLKAEHAGTVISLQTFRPTPFTPTITSALTEQSIHPSIPLTQQPYNNPTPESVVPGTTAGKTFVMAHVSDGLDCMNTKFLKDTEITLQSIVVPDSASHRHFTSVNQVGTGRFFKADPSSANPEAIPTTSSIPSEITLKPDEIGSTWAMYKAGHFGIEENIEITAKNSTTGAQSSPTAQHRLSIKMPDLVPLDTSGVDYYIRGTGNEGCDLGHNASATTRRSHYVLPYMETLVTTLAKWYTLNTGGLKLSYNDASLEYGGFFDKGNNDNLTQRCHLTHREGLDIDVNSNEESTCPDASNLDCISPGLSPDNQEMTRLEFLTNTVKQWKGYRWNEGNLIHYRFNYLHQ
ncbi:MAG: hypothetical protein OQL08_07630 [Gammaproteobacteria bacterium]|nr:hypothetical protein [Gammaproteobacteria bacterium]